MRLHTALALLVAVSGSIGTATADTDGSRLVRCQRMVMHDATALVARRAAALDRCVTKALRCPGALAANAPADDACLAAVGLRCRRRLAAVWPVYLRVEAAGPRCTAPAPPGVGVAPEDFLDPDGLAFADLATFCPQQATAVEAPADASHCQDVALACASDAAVATAAPRAAELLARLGVTLDGGCLGASLCGNGAIDGDEECDDGPGNSDTAPDACRTSCVAAYCGDGVVDDGEDCDDGNDVDGDGCDTDCTIPEGTCGNGIVEGDEECDDGNQIDGDGCDSDCTASGPECGDGVVDPDEDCDDGRRNSDRLPDRCRTDCTAPSCGDGVVDVGHGETCEPPGTIVCDDDCRVALPGLPALAGSAPIVAPADLVRCQAGVVRASARLLARTRTLEEGCIGMLAHCMLVADGGDACLAAANHRCARVPSARDALARAAFGRLAAACRAADGTPLPLAALLASGDGLGFETLAAGCPATGAPATQDLLACVAATVQCRAENLVARTIPRAYDLLSNLDLDADAAFPCVTDPEAE